MSLVPDPQNGTEDSKMEVVTILSRMSGKTPATLYPNGSKIKGFPRVIKLSTIF
jgi:hypothetical protein